MVFCIVNSQWLTTPLTILQLLGLWIKRKNCLLFLFPQYTNIQHDYLDLWRIKLTSTLAYYKPKWFINYVTWHVKQTGYSYPFTVSLDFFSALHSCTKLLLSSVRGTCTYVLSRRWCNSNWALTSDLQLRALRRNCLSKWELGCFYYRFTLFIVTFMNADHTRCRSLAIDHDIAVFLPFSIRFELFLAVCYSNSMNFIDRQLPVADWVY